ncbi:MAG TPA: hypothetical protein DIW54_11510 [Chitinophagaceae bacterium]|nr:hypothetical protein [Chitinophagaceae bacterium]HCT23907.1 hypothetical protein [Chitinophagaceae bacterium]
MADSLLRWALDHEALYTLCDTLKPMSSVRMYRLPLLSPQQTTRDSAQQILNQLNRVAQALRSTELSFIVNPFERSDSIYKNIELYAIRNHRLKQLIQEKEIFYGKLGIAPNTTPDAVLAITEYEQKYTRWQSYGYLFGYPEHAVQFFVQAGKQQDSTGKFVQRDFIHIPVAVANSGYFTYAVPKGYAPTAIDSSIQQSARLTLSRYQLLKKQYRARSNSVWRILRKMNSSNQ